MSVLMRAACAAAMLVAANAAPAMAQTIGGSGTFGTVSLNAGFQPDPYVVEIAAGGTTDVAQTVGDTCRGMIASNPDITVDYAAGNLGLYFSALSSSDTTLVVYAPDKLYYCDDDSAEGLNPGVYLPSPPAGRYQVWVGTYAQDGGTPPATVYISEIGYIETLREQGLIADSGATQITTSDSSATLNAGFSPDPYNVSLAAGGTVNVNAAFSQCTGWVTDPSNFVLTYTSGTLPLIFSATSSVDTTLVIEAPDGQVYCDDDSGNAGLVPMINFQTPLTGVYNIWVGTYSSSAAGTPAVLHISELTSQ